MTALKSASGWFCAGSRPQQYEMGIDPEVRFQGQSTGSIRSKVSQAEGFGTLMQMCMADTFLGKRVRLTARVRTEDVENWAGLWFRIDGPQKGRSLGFDNMQDRPFKGTSDWQAASIVLDVPPESVAVAFGILLDGLGKVWIGDISIEPVGPEVSTTGCGADAWMLARPTNLDFSQLAEG